MTSTFTRRTGALSLVAFALALLPLALAAHAQEKSADPCAAMRNAPTETRTFTFFLANMSSDNEGIDMLNAVRNVLCPGTRVYFEAPQRAIIVQAPPEQLALAGKIIHDLDRPQKAYRLAYTITELDGDKTISTQHISMVAVVGQHTSVKEGDKVPLATGSYSGENSTSQTQFTYIDVGMNFDATLGEQADGVSLKSKVEQSSVSSSSTIMGVTEPVIRQTVLDGTALLTLDKPVMLGSIDVPTTTRRFDIAVVLQQVK
jgi:type II secretory pathway component GspD/PulD (secretin)